MHRKTASPLFRNIIMEDGIISIELTYTKAESLKDGLAGISKPVLVTLFFLFPYRAGWYNLAAWAIAEAP